MQPIEIYKGLEPCPGKDLPGWQSAADIFLHLLSGLWQWNTC
jgi:hypothetical protein